MEVWVDGRRYQVEAAIAIELAVPVLFGEDLPLEELILDKNYRTGEDEGSKREEVLAVLTRAQTKRKEQQVVEEQAMPVEVTVQEETGVTEQEERSTRRALSKERNENAIHPDGHTDGEGAQMEDSSKSPKHQE